MAPSEDTSAAGAVVAPGRGPAAAAAADAVAGLSRERRRFVHTTEAQRRCVVEWLEQPPNFQLLARGAPPVRTADGRKLKKADGFRALTRHVNARTDSEWDLETTRSRYESLLQTFTKARRAIEHPDFGISTADRARGLVDPAQKRDALCLFYDRLDALHRTGGRALGRSAGDDDGDGLALSVTAEVQGESFGESVAAAAKESKETVLMAVQDAASQGLASVHAVNDFVSPPPKRQRHSYANGADTASRRASTEPTSRRSSVEPSRRASVDPGSRWSSMDPGSLAATPDSRRSYLPDGYDGYDGDDADDDDDDGVSPRKNEALDVQRLALLQEQVRLKQRELDLKERELMAQNATRKQALRAELTTKLVTAGKSLEEIRGYLALLDG